MRRVILGIGYRIRERKDKDECGEDREETGGSWKRHVAVVEQAPRACSRKDDVLLGEYLAPRSHETPAYITRAHTFCQLERYLYGPPFGRPSARVPGSPGFRVAL